MEPLLKTILVLAALLLLPFQAIPAATAVLPLSQELKSDELRVSDGCGCTAAQSFQAREHNAPDGAAAAVAPGVCGHTCVIHLPGTINVVFTPAAPAWVRPLFVPPAAYIPEQPRRPPRA